MPYNHVETKTILTQLAAWRILVMVGGKNLLVVNGKCQCYFVFFEVKVRYVKTF